jgi:hypothetical protein
VAARVVVALAGQPGLERLLLADQPGLERPQRGGLAPAASSRAAASAWPSRSAASAWACRRAARSAPGRRRARGQRLSCSLRSRAT